MAEPVRVTMWAGPRGLWRIDSISAFRGESLPGAERLEVIEGATGPVGGGAWALVGFSSNARYTNEEEKARLAALRPELGRADSTRGALIPIRKTAAWWELAQDTRRAIMQETSRHITIGMEYMPAIARRLLHSRDLGEPFDFLTWFEYAPGDSGAFEELVGRLRSTEEWAYVDREVDIRLTRDGVRG